MKNKTIIIFALLLLTMLFAGCEKNSPPEPCPLCMDLAFKIFMVDSTGNKLSGFTVKFIDA